MGKFWHRWRIGCLIVWVGWGVLYAHGDIHQRIADATRQIEADPGNRALYLKRGELFRLHGEWEPALADYQKAADLDPAADDVRFLRGRMWVEAGEPQLALAELDSFLARHPDHVQALLSRSRGLADVGRFLEAADDQESVIRAAPKPAPEFYLDRTRLLLAAGTEHADAAMQCLDDGLRVLGPLVTLVEAAVQLESNRGRFESALKILDHLPDSLKEHANWLAQRAGLLERAGRGGEAAGAYREALQALDRLPESRRNTRASRELRKKIEDALAGMQNPS